MSESRFSVGDIVELCAFGSLLWEVVEDVFFEIKPIQAAWNHPVANIRVVYWGCPPNVKLDSLAVDRLRLTNLSLPQRVELSGVRNPTNAIMVIAISASDNQYLVGKGSRPWLGSTT